MNNKMTDTETRAELERMDDPEQTLPWLFRITAMELEGPTAVSLATIKALRLLAEKHKALRKISGLLQHQLDNEDSGDLVTILQLLDALMIIAKNACKEK